MRVCGGVSGDPMEIAVSGEASWQSGDVGWCGGASPIFIVASRGGASFLSMVASCGGVSLVSMVASQVVDVGLDLSCLATDGLLMFSACKSKSKRCPGVSPSMCGMICGRGVWGRFFWLLSFGKSFCRRGWYCFLQKTGRESERVWGGAVEGGCAVSRFGLAEGLLVEPFARSHCPSAWAVGVALRGVVRRWRRGVCCVQCCVVWEV